MKKIILLFLLIFSLKGMSQSGVATASNQTIGNNYLATIAGGATGGSVAASACTLVTATGTLAAGVRSVLFQGVSGFTGSVNGFSFTNTSYFRYPSVVSYTYGTIPYVVSSGSMNICPVR